MMINLRHVILGCLTDEDCPPGDQCQNWQCQPLVCQHPDPNAVILSQVGLIPLAGVVQIECLPGKVSHFVSYSKVININVNL